MPSDSDNTPKRVSLIDKLEDMIIREAFEYALESDGNLNYDLENSALFFNSVIPNKIYDDFELETYDWLRSLPNESRGLELFYCVNQFNKNNPVHRVEVFYNKYRRILRDYRSSESLNKLSSDEKRFINILLDKYNVHFNKFRKLIKKLSEDYHTNRLNLNAHIFKSQPIDQVVESNDEHLDEKIKEFIIKSSQELWANNNMTLIKWKISGIHYSLSSLINNQTVTWIPIKEKILKQAARCYHEYVEELLNEKFMHPFEDIDEAKKRAIAKDDQRIINDLLKGEVDDSLAEKLRKFFYIEDWKKVRNQIALIERRRINPEINYDIFSPECFAHTEAILKYQDFLKEYLNVADVEPEGHKSVDKPREAVNLASSFESFIIHPLNKEIAAKLKEDFKNKKGKSLRIMIEVLKNQPTPLMHYENRQRKNIHKAMKEYFGWDIGSYQSIWDMKFDTIDRKDYEAVELKILSLLKSVEEKNKQVKTSNL